MEMDLFCGYYKFKEEKMSELEIKEVKVLRALPGDVVVFKSCIMLTESHADALEVKLKEEFPENRVLVLDKGSDVSVIREGVDSDADTGS